MRFEREALVFIVGLVKHMWEYDWCRVMFKEGQYNISKSKLSYRIENDQEDWRNFCTCFVPKKHSV